MPYGPSLQQLVRSDLEAKTSEASSGAGAWRRLDSQTRLALVESLLTSKADSPDSYSLAL